MRCEVDRLAADDRAQDLGVQDFLRGGRGQVVVQHDHVGEVAGCKLALEPLLVLGEGLALRVGVERLLEGDLFLRLEGLGSGLIHAGNSRVETPEE